MGEGCDHDHGHGHKHHHHHHEGEEEEEEIKKKKEMEIKSSNSKSKTYEKSYFDVLGICCSSEVGVIEKILKPLEGVHQVSVIVPSRTVIVHHDSLLISQLQIVNALNKARLEANVRVKGESSHQKKWPSPFAIACGILCLLSLLKFAYRPFEWLGLGAVAVGIYPILLKGIASVRNFRLDINILMIIAVAASIALKDYCEAGAIVFLFTIAQWLESRASHKATSLMSSLMSISPQRAVLVETGEEVDVSEVMVNTVLAVKAGDIIPLDGIVVDGKCEVDQKTLTGESFPVAKQIDSSVFAGTINLNGYISVKTTALADDCVVARMAKLVEEAQNNKSKTQRFIDKCAIYYTPAVVVLSACLAIIPVALGVHNRNQWYHLALVVLVSACPCSLILSTPTATFCALAKAATSGLLIKGAEYLETLAKVKVVAFDKTGTITRGEFLVTDFHPFMEGVSLDALLYWVSSIESKSSHPMAAALVNYAQAHAVEPKPEKVEEFQNFPGEGIYGKIDGECIYVGNRKIAVRAGCADVPTSDNLTNEGKSMGYIFLGSSCAGTFNLSDVCRTGVAEALKELKSMSIKTVMLTGDCQAAAKHAQDELGGVLDEVHAELLPEDKARFIKEYQKKSPTTMVGDGLNDAAALATADIGISMGVSGSALATETGHITLMSNDIRKIPFAVRLAKKGHMKIIENVALSFTIKAGIVGLAIAGYPLVWAAVLADVGTCLLVIFNSMLLLRGTAGYRRKHYSSSHDHKHGCKQTHSHSSHSHGHSRCASGSKASNKCMTQTCCSKTSVPSSCESNKKCSDSKTKHGCCESPLPVKTSSGNNMCSESKDVHGCCETNKCSDSKNNASCCDTGPLSSAPHGNNKHGYCESGFTISRVYGNDKCPELKSTHSCCESPFISVSHGDENCSKQENKHGCCDPGPHSAASCGKNSDLENKHHHGSNKCSNSEDKPGCCEANKKGSVSKNSSNCCKSRLSSSLSSASHGNSKHGCCESGLHISVRGGNDNCVELKNPHGCCEPLSIPTSDGDEMCPNLENKHGCCDSGSLIAVSCTENCLESENEHAHGINKCSDSENKPACCESASSIKSQDNSLCLESENVHGCCTHADQVHAHEHLVHGSSSDVITIDIEKQDVPSAQGCAVHSYPSSCSEKHFHEKSHHGMLHCHGAHEAKHSDHHGIAGTDSEPIGSCKSHHGMLHCHGAHEAKHSDHHGIASTDGEPIGSCKSHHRTLHCHGAHEAKYSDHHGITGTDSEPIGSCKSHHGVLHCHGVHKAKHSDHGTAGTGSEPMGSCNAHEHSNHACEISEVCGNVKGNKHCHHGKAYITEEELKHMVRTCCEYYSSNHHKVQSGCKNHHGSNHGSRAHGCMSLEKRHVGGCCKSFREECCGKGTPFPLGGLSEIVIE